MDDFKHLFNEKSFYETIFIKIESEFDISQIKNPKLWEDFMKKAYKNDLENLNSEEFNDLIKIKSKSYGEFSKISSIAWGVVSINDKGISNKTIQNIAGSTEKEKLDKFFKILNFFNEKKSNPIICGFNLLSFEIPFLIKRGLKNKMKIPNIITSNLTAKPWDYKIVDISKLFKFTGLHYTNFDIIEEFLEIDDSNKINCINDDEFTYKRVNSMIDLYKRLREIK